MVNPLGVMSVDTADAAQHDEPLVTLLFQSVTGGIASTVQRCSQRYADDGRKNGQVNDAIPLAELRLHIRGPFFAYGSTLTAAGLWVLAANPT